MNASEQAKNLEITSKIATIVNLFKSEFPDARADLKPWRNDPDTRQLIDPDSIDIGFHFPGWSPRFQSRSMLLQIRFYEDAGINKAKLIGLDIAAFNHQGEAWRFSTVDWHCAGKSLPVEAVIVKLQNFCRQVFALFYTESS